MKLKKIHNMFDTKTFFAFCDGRSRSYTNKNTLTPCDFF